MAPLAFTPCVAGMAGIYPCNNVDLGAFLPNSTIGGGSGSSIWGWTDPLTGKEYALMGRTNGTAFVDISNPASPIYVGNLPSATGSSSWRELKAYDTFAYIISDPNGQHGMQVFDLTQLRNVSTPPVTLPHPVIRSSAARTTSRSTPTPAICTSWASRPAALTLAPAACI